MTNTFNYKGIVLAENQSVFEFNGSYLGEPIIGYALDLEEAKEKIDLSIKLIEEDGDIGFNYSAQKKTKQSNKHSFSEED